MSEQDQVELETAIEALHYGAEYAVVTAGTVAAVERLHNMAGQLGFQIRTVPNGDGGLNIWRIQ